MFLLGWGGGGEGRQGGQKHTEEYHTDEVRANRSDVHMTASPSPGGPLPFVYVEITQHNTTQHNNAGVSKYLRIECTMDPSKRLSAGRGRGGRRGSQTDRWEWGLAWGHADMGHGSRVRHDMTPSVLSRLPCSALPVQLSKWEPL